MEKDNNNGYIISIIILVILFISYFMYVAIGEHTPIYDRPAIVNEIEHLGDTLCNTKGCNYMRYEDIPSTGKIADKIICDCRQPLIKEIIIY